MITKFDKFLNENNNNTMIFYHGTTEYFKDFKYKKGTFNDANYIAPIFLSSDKDFALSYSGQSKNSYLYTVKVNTDNIFDYRLLAYPDDILEYEHSDLKNPEYDYDISIKLYDYIYDNWDKLEKYASYEDELYTDILGGDYSSIEQVWFYEWLKENNYNASYLMETKVLNILVFDKTDLEIINIKYNNLNESKSNKNT